MNNNDDKRTRFTLRMPNELHEAIKRLAEKNKRTVTKEIEFILEQHFQNASKESSR